MDQATQGASAPSTPAPSAACPAPAFLLDQCPPKDDFAADVLKGLSQPQKYIPPKYFYDARGSALFERICRTPEYYVTRTELQLLAEIGPDLASLVGPEATVVEFGSGSDAKIRRLLDALEAPHAYVAIDISREPLERAVEDLARDYDGLTVGGICADFTAPLTLPEQVLAGPGKRVGFFPGSTVGNMERDRCRTFLAHTREMFEGGDGFIIGVDLRKDSAILEPAYNDADGVTAEFNLNVLRRINLELGGDIRLANFAHHALYNEELGRVEMHLRSLADQRFTVAGREFEMEEGETIHTENSYKYGVEEFIDAAEGAGYRPRRTWQDERSLFSIHYLEAA
ncbi:MAG: L-histidine N(alpha)-methyltransferase [Alphaproteobacteria bacterium]|nr:L-histidine N(alpha)-methyltransferase [Alphaproteobacteria bacterium]